MLRTIIISPDAEAAARLGETLDRFMGKVQLCRTVDHYPPTVDLLRILRAHAPEIVFLSFDNVPLALETVKVIESNTPGLQVIAMHRNCEANLLIESMRAGIREFLASPFDDNMVAEALKNVEGLLQKRPPLYESTQQILSFLPSKAGVGATTLALNVSAALARGNEGSVLVSDLDLNSGMLRFLLKLNNEYSVVDAVENALDMDENIWPQLVSSKSGLDILHAGRVNPNLRIEPAQVRALLQFMRRNYKALVFDMSGNLERYSLEVMQESRQIFMVCTPEIPSLHLAREKMGFLKTVGLDSKVSVLLNRVSKKPLFTNQQVEELVGAKVQFSFPNDYFAVSRATTAGQCLEKESTIGAQCAAFARTLGDKRPSASPTEKRKKFLQYFNVGSTPQMVAQD